MDFSQRERVVLLLGLFAREREIRISIRDAKLYGLVTLERLQEELQECLTLQKRIG